MRDDGAVFVFNGKDFVGLAEEFLTFGSQFDLHGAFAALPFWRNGLCVQDSDGPVKTVAGEIRTGTYAHVSPTLFDKFFHIRAALFFERSSLATGRAASENNDIEVIEDAVANLLGGNFGDFDVVAFAQLGADARNAFTGGADVVIESNFNRFAGGENKFGRTDRKQNRDSEEESFHGSKTA